MIGLVFAALVFQVEWQKILIVIAAMALGALAVFFLYSIFVLALYWLIMLLPLLALGAGIYLRLQEATAGNVTIGIAVVWAVIWYALVLSKKSNWLRRILNSLNRSLP